MALAFVPSDAALICLQAGCVAAPRLAPGVRKLDRFHGRGWALVPVTSIVGVIFAIRYVSNTADWLTWLALIGCPLGSVVALGWAMRGPRSPAARTAMALLVVPLFLIVDRSQSSLTGEACGAILSALSCVTLGVLLAAVAPSGLLKLGIVAMSVADVWLVVSDLLQNPNNTLVAASPGSAFGHPLPKLQSESFGTVNMGYGDLFIAAVFGALLSGNARRQTAGALLTLVLAGAFDLLFFFVNELPATVPVAVALIITEAWAWRARRRARGPTEREPSALRRRWRPAAVTPRRAT
jgi:hypothetical protein